MRAKAFFFLWIVFFTATQFVHAQDESELAHFMQFFSANEPGPLEKTLHDKNLKLEQAREIGDGAEQARILRELGLVHLNRVHNYEKAMDLFIRALTIEDSLDLIDQKVLTYVAVARVFEVVGDFHKSAKFLDQALSLNKESRSINTVAMILNNLGKVNAARGRVDDAFENFRQVLRYESDIDGSFKAEALFNLGHLLTAQGNYDKALMRHKEALAVTRVMSDTKLEAQSLNDIGVLYGLMKNDEKSLANHQVALEIRQRISDKRGVAESRNNIAALNLKRKDPRAAIAHGLVALQNGREAQAQDQIFRSSDLLSQAYKDMGDYKSALSYKELTVAIQELIQGERVERNLLETENRYVVERKESEIQKLDALRIEREREIANQKKFRNILFLVVALVVVTAGLLLILYLVKRRSNRILHVAKKEVQKQNVRLQELNNTKDKFFSIISHDLKGPLNSLTSFSRLLIDHTDSMSKEEIRMLAKDLDKSVKNLLTLLENLLEWSRSQTGNIDFTPEPLDLSELLETNKSLLHSQAAAKGITLNTECPEPFVVALHKQSINTVVRNLTSNAIKFTPEGGKIWFGAKKEHGRLHVWVRDSGVGMSSDVIEKLFRLDSKHSTRGTANEKGTGLGLVLCREFVEKNGGTIRVESTPGKGSTFSFSFPERVCVNAGRIAEPVSS